MVKDLQLGEINFVVKGGKVTENNLLFIKTQIEDWSKDIVMAKIETPADILAGSQVIKNCQEAEKELKKVKTNAIKGELFKALKEIDDLAEAVRQGRLSLTHAVNDCKETLRQSAINSALDVVKGELEQFEYLRPDICCESRLQESLKKLSAIESMELALKNEVKAIVDETRKYNDMIANNMKVVENMFEYAGEKITHEEIENIVIQFRENSAMRATCILDERKRVKALAAAPRQETQETEEPQKRKEDVPLHAYRFGVTFETNAPSVLIAQLERLGGTNIKVIDMATREAANV
jgi:hypothetical protein